MKSSRAGRSDFVWYRGRRDLVVALLSLVAVTAAGILGVLAIEANGKSPVERSGPTALAALNSAPSPDSLITANWSSPSPSTSASASATASPSASPSPSKKATTTAAEATTHQTSPAAASPSTGIANLVAGTYTIDRTLVSTSNLALTLTQITVTSSGTVTVDVSYRNTSSSNLILTCGGLGDATVNRLTRSDGTVYKATHSYCSDNPNAVFELAAWATSQSYAIFDGVTGQNYAFSFAWQSGTSLTGTVSGIVL